MNGKRETFKSNALLFLGRFTASLFCVGLDLYCVALSRQRVRLHLFMKRWFGMIVFRKVQSDITNRYLSLDQSDRGSDSFVIHLQCKSVTAAKSFQSVCLLSLEKPNGGKWTRGICPFVLLYCKKNQHQHLRSVCSFFAATLKKTITIIQNLYLYLY